MKFNRISLHSNTLILLLFLLTGSLFAQEYNLKIIFPEENSVRFLKKKSYIKIFSDTVKLRSELNKIRNKLYTKGYIAASTDSLVFDSLNVKAYFFIGKKYQILKIITSENDENIIRKLNINFNKNKKTNPLQLINTYEKIIRYYENNGYPFAQIITNKVEFEEEKIKLNIKIDKNKQIFINQIIIKGTDKLPETFIKHYISISENDIYNEKLISEISSKIENLSFVSQIRKPEVEFIGNKANVYIYLKNKKANLFNGIVGFIPEKENDYKLSFSGNIKLKLTNNFSKGEEIFLIWNRAKKLSQKLKLKTNVPFIFKSPFGLNLNFSLDKKDTTYMTVSETAGFDYSFKNNDKIFVYAKKNNSYILSEKYIDTTLYSNVSTISFGIAYQTKRLNYLLNPSKGFYFLTDIKSGKRNVNSKENNYINSQLIFDLYFPVINKFVFKTSIKNNYIFSKKIIYKNEMFKTGGFNSVRGFDEDAFSASGYSIFTNEIRFLYEKNSNIYLFSDIARTVQQKNTKTFLFGFGIGTNFSTKAGIFSLAYALGKTNNSPLQLSSSKIHIGYINMF